MQINPSMNEDTPRAVNGGDSRMKFDTTERAAPRSRSPKPNNV